MKGVFLIRMLSSFQIPKVVRSWEAIKKRKQIEAFLVGAFYFYFKLLNWSKLIKKYP